MENNQEEQNKSSLRETILAAGAILWRKEPFASDIAVIHRTRYGGEWCLPKDKVQLGETLEKATAQSWSTVNVKLKDQNKFNHAG